MPRHDQLVAGGWTSSPAAVHQFGQNVSHHLSLLPLLPLPLWLLQGTDAWSIHRGSCMFGYLAYNRATGWDVTAISDRAGDYKGSCG
jgi:hypothetical protein